MAQQTISNTYSSNVDISIPNNAINLRLDVAAASGGRGGNDAQYSGGPGGSGRFGMFTLPNSIGRTLSLNIGGIGLNGVSSQSSAPGGSGGSGVASGGRGGNAGPGGSSGGGGGGGGATGVYDSFSNSWIIVAGGGGGGGGAAWPNVPGLNGGTGLEWGGGSVSTISNGGTGGTCPSDGSGGGGGGGGASGGAGGANGFDVSSGNVRAQGGVGGGSGYRSSFCTWTGASSNNSGNGYVTVQYTLLTPQINSFSASPNPQTSGSDGVPNYDTTLSWNTSDVTSVSISGIGAVGATGSELITNLPQSVAGSNSPATRTYTLTACAGSTCVNQTITVSVYNDNTPNNFSFPNRSNLEPNTVTSTSAQITGIDMPTVVTAGPNVQVSVDNSTWASTRLVSNNGTAFARASSPAFNTDPSGLTNSAQFYADVGPLRRFFTLTTRAPDVNETFNYSNEDDRVPYPDIDTITTAPDHPAEQYISSNTLTVDDIEIPVEVKTNNSNAQVRIKRTGASGFDNWQDVRSI